MANVTLNTISSFQRGSYPFPKDQIPNKEKGAEWSRKWCQAMYAAYVTDRAGVPYSSIEELIELRRYASGTQNVIKYQDILLDESEEGGDLTGYLNVDWEIFSVMPKFLHIIRGIFEEQEHSIVATAVDPTSNKERDVEKLRKWFKGRYKPILDAVNEFSGYKPEPEWIPETVDELEMYQQVGGFKLAKETEIEQGLSYTMYISDWKEIKRKMLDDFATINCAAVKDFTDQYTRKVKARWVDPVRLIMQYSKHWDHRNSEYGGEIVSESISNIRKNTGISETKLRELAQFYNGRNANQNLASWTEEDLQINGGGWKYDNFMIDIMDAEWFSINSKNFTTRTNARGESRKYEEEDDKFYDNSTRKTTTNEYKVVYRAKWIVGTEFVYDYGLQYDVPRKGKKEVELSYKFYKLPGRSIVSLSVPNLDQIQLTWLKMQNALAMSANSGIAVEYTSLMNMKLGGEKMEPLDILSIRRDTGDLIYKTTTHMGKPNVPGGMRPIQELVGGIGPQLQEFITLFDLNLNFIRDLTGINQVADASNPDPNQSVGGAEMAIAATANALKPIYAGYIRLKELVARAAAIRIQLLVRHDKKAYEGYIPVVGGAGVKILSIGTEVLDADWEIQIQAKPTAQRKQMIMEAAMKSMQPDKDGFVGIEEADFMMIERMLEAGNEKLAEIVLNFRSKKNKDRQLKIQRENMDLDAKNAQQTAATKGDQDRQTKKFESDLKIQQDTNKLDLEDRNNNNEHERKMQQISLEKSFDAAQAEQSQKTA
ncbi:MAG: hypothetical protein DRI97_00125 [Bacteroidetes bacterium]|nr:MAG: hypothetical protein DRI97_00125 [Bacteroidota bacterium]